MIYRITMATILAGALWASPEIPEKSTRHFSPNLDGAKDTLPIPLNIRKDGYLTKWKVLIAKQSGSQYTVIRTYESTSAKEINRLTPGKFFKRLVEKKEKIAVPAFVPWDGLMEAQQGSNKILVPAPHGIYFVQILAIDESENESRTPWIAIYLDLIKPVVGLSCDTAIFSPNGDGRKDTAIFTMPRSNMEPLDGVRLEVRAATNNTPMAWVWSNNALPPSFVWNGLDPTGKPMAEGPYRFRVVSYDLAANSNISSEWNLELVRTVETLQVAVATGLFSPNGDGQFDLVSFAPKASSRKGLESWSLAIRPSGSPQGVRTWKGANDLSELVSFDGKDDGGKVLPDGVYEVFLEAQYDSGNHPLSPVGTIEIDDTAPVVEAKATAANFIPVATREGRKVMSFDLSGKGRPGDRFRVEILDDSKAAVFSLDFQGPPPSSWAWDGKNQSGEIIPGRYTLSLRGRDSVENTARADSSAFELIGEESQATTSPDITSFSPGKGRDRVLLKTDITQKNLVTRQVLTLYNEKKEPVRRVETNAFSPSFQFDGRDETGKPLPDGRYTYQIEYELTTGEKPVAVGRPISLDTTPVAVRPPQHPFVFSPNQDGRMDQLEISFSSEPSSLNPEQDRLTLSIRDAKGKVFRQLSYVSPFPNKFVWDGKDQTGAPSPEGEYTIFLETIDSALNRATVSGKPFGLVRTPDVVDLAISRNVMSAALKEKVEMIPSLGNNPRFLTNVTAVLVDEKGARYVVASRKDAGAFVFNGFDVAGKALKDARYLVQVIADFSSGNQAISPNRDLLLSSRPPDIRLVTQPEYFSPDQDGLDDTLRMGVKISHPLGVARSEMSLYRHIRLTNEKGRPVADYLGGYLAANQKPFKTWALPEGEVDAQWEWDGVGDGGEKVESANDYVLFVKSIDRAGNVTNLAKAIPVDVLVEKLADGRLRIILNSITFGFDSARLDEGDGLRVLDRLVYILGKFPEYHIHIVGHTDSRGAPQHNTELSTARARSVLQYLVDRDVAATRLTADGKGASELQISPEENADNFIQEENYRKNRRVEFFLDKKREVKK